jgi:hypothetical protein
VSASRKINGFYNGEVEICHGPFLILDGIDSALMVRCVFEIYAWLLTVGDPHILLANTIEAAKLEMGNTGNHIHTSSHPPVFAKPRRPIQKNCKLPKHSSKG